MKKLIVGIVALVTVACMNVWAELSDVGNATYTALKQGLIESLPSSGDEVIDEAYCEYFSLVLDYLIDYVRYTAKSDVVIDMVDIMEEMNMNSTPRASFAVYQAHTERTFAEQLKAAREAGVIK